MTGAFPTHRPRRLRRTDALRHLVAETRLGVDDLVAPLFVREDIDEPQPIHSLPGVVQHTRESLRKEVRELSGVECLVRGPTLDPLRLLVAQARIAYEPYRLVGYVHLDDRYFWVHAWAKSYRELDARAFETVQELAEVAFDVGVQLGKGHPKHIATPMDAQLRRDVLTYVRDHASEIHETCRALADETVAAWTRAKASLDTPKPRP